MSLSRMKLGGLTILALFGFSALAIAADSSRDIPIRVAPRPSLSEAVRVINAARNPLGTKTPETHIVSPNALIFQPLVTPCRIVDTRNSNYLYGGPIFANHETRVYSFFTGHASSECVTYNSDLPANVLGWYANITITAPVAGPGFLTTYPDGTSRPTAATLNWASAGDQVNNSVIIPGAEPNGIFDLYASTSTHVIIDLQGIFISNLSDRGDQLAIITNPLAAKAAILGQNDSTTDSSIGVEGHATASSGATIGVEGISDSTGAGTIGVLGTVTSSSSSPNAAGVKGVSASTSSVGIGVWGNQNGSGWGVYGFTPSGRGVYGASTDGTGVYADSVNQTALVGVSAGLDGGYLQGGRNGVFGNSIGTSGFLTGVIGSEASFDLGSSGVRGNDASGFPNGGNGAFQFLPAGVLGLSDINTAVHGVSRFGGGTPGRFTRIDSSSPFGPLSDVFLASGSSTAAVFSGNVNIQVGASTGSGDLSVQGTVSKGGGSFKIDHPLDPEHKYLYHSFVESPDMMNVYNGIVVLDQTGEAVVELPEYFEALNKDFRYQLTSIGRFAPLYIAEKIQDNKFRIGGGRPGGEVSWQVTGVRKDGFANAHRIQVEVAKEPEAQGYYLHPTELGKKPQAGIGYRLLQAERVREAQESQARAAAAAQK